MNSNTYDNSVLLHIFTVLSILLNIRAGLGKNSYKRVAGAKITQLGGFTYVDWFDLFGKSLFLFHLHVTGNIQQRDISFFQFKVAPRSQKTGCKLDTFLNPDPDYVALKHYSRCFPGMAFSLFLDIKSNRASPIQLSCLVNLLNSRGIHVHGVASFLKHVISGISKIIPKQNVVSSVLYNCKLVIRDQPVIRHFQVFEQPKEIRLFHFAGNLQKELDNSIYTLGESMYVLFNGGSLFTYTSWTLGDSKTKSYRLNYSLLTSLRAYKSQFKLHVGFYVQECDLDASACAMLIELANSDSELFDLGFAWGAVSLPPADICASFWSARVGSSSQWWMGRQWV